MKPIRVKEEIFDDRGFVIGIIYEDAHGNEILCGDIPEIQRRRRTAELQKAA